MYIETNTTELNVQAGNSDTAELRFTRAFGAIRMTMVDGTNAGTAPGIESLDQLLVELPSRGGLSRRLNLSGTEVHMAPLIAALGASTADEAASSSSYEMFYDAANGASLTPAYSYIDIPVGAAANEEIRITVKCASGFTNGISFKFSALTNVADRNLIFDVNSLGTGSRLDHTFRRDVSPLAIVAGAGAAAYTFEKPTASNASNMPKLTEINFDGLPAFTYDDVAALACELDKVITSSSVSNGRDASVVDLAFAEVPDNAKKVNLETSASTSMWTVVSYEVVA